MKTQITAFKGFVIISGGDRCKSVSMMGILDMDESISGSRVEDIEISQEAYDILAQFPKSTDDTYAISLSKGILHWQGPRNSILYPKDLQANDDYQIDLLKGCIVEDLKVPETAKELIMQRPEVAEEHSEPSLASLNSLEDELSLFEKTQIEPQDDYFPDRDM